MSHQIDIIANLTSESSGERIEKIVPLFREQGEDDISLTVTDDHYEARNRAAELVRGGRRILIVAGNSETFNAALEGCFDARADFSSLRLGFLHDRPTDLIGEVLRMPRRITEAVKVCTESIRADRTLSSDTLSIRNAIGCGPVRHFIGYGGTELLSDIPYYAGNRFITHFEGFLRRALGDAGPYLIGTQLAIGARLFRRLRGDKRYWDIMIDGIPVARGRYQALVFVNGDLGPNMPLARDVSLGSGDFRLFAFADRGPFQLFRQLQHAWDGSILENPAKWGMKIFRVSRQLTIQADPLKPFALNIDGTIVACRGSARVDLGEKIRLLAGR